MPLKLLDSVRRGLFVLVLCSLLPNPTHAIIITAEVSDTPGLDGYQTYTLTASSDIGFVAGFNFGAIDTTGITGPLYQQPGVPSVFVDSPNILKEHVAFTDAAAIHSRVSPPDTRFLVSTRDGLSIDPGESSSHLQAVYAFIGHEGQHTHRSLPFVQIVTDDPESVDLSGKVLVRQLGRAFPVTTDVNLSLAEVMIGAAPELPEPLVYSPPPPPPRPTPPPAPILAADPPPAAEPPPEPRAETTAPPVFVEAELIKRINQLENSSHEESQFRVLSISTGISLSEHPDFRTTGVTRIDPIGLPIGLTNRRFELVSTIDLPAISSEQVLNLQGFAYEGDLAFSTTFFQPASTAFSQSAPEPGSGLLAVVLIPLLAAAARVRSDR